jgi:hypothetical protein
VRTRVTLESGFAFRFGEKSEVEQKGLDREFLSDLRKDFDTPRSLLETTVTCFYRGFRSTFDFTSPRPFCPRVVINQITGRMEISPCETHVCLSEVCFSIRRYVVVDEAHAYGGVFGCHTALILRRLRRICSQVYGSHPTFVVCSATVANPKEHAQARGRPDCRLANLSLELYGF